jgi:molybdate transport system regulatory protein
LDSRRPRAALRRRLATVCPLLRPSTRSPAIPTLPAGAGARARNDTNARHDDRAHPLDLAGHVHPNLKGWLSWDGAFLVGPRYIRLLEGVERTGTLRGACDATGLSYRTCMNRVRQMERTLGVAMIETRRGGAERGGAELTPAAHQLVRVYRLWREDVERARRQAFDRATKRWARVVQRTPRGK